RHVLANGHVAAEVARHLRDPSGAHREMLTGDPRAVAACLLHGDRLQRVERDLVRLLALSLPHHAEGIREGVEPALGQHQRAPQALDFFLEEGNAPEIGVTVAVAGHDLSPYHGSRATMSDTSRPRTTARSSPPRSPRIRLAPPAPARRWRPPPPARRR